MRADRAHHDPVSSPAGARALRLALVAAVAHAGCAAPPPHAARPPVAAALPNAAPATLAPPARWVDAGGATVVGPTSARGTLVLLGGRRALVTKAGVAVEREPMPEPLVELAEVPAADGRLRLVARGAHGVYRLDDPLGAPVALARSEVELARLGTWPGLCVLWDRGSSLPRYVDVETGELRAAPRLPEPLLTAVAFRDAREGAAVFEGTGLCTTTDGGASWRPIALEAAPGDAGRAEIVRRDGDLLRASTRAGAGLDAPVDAARAALGPFESTAGPAGEAPLLRWVRVTGRDPLEVAILAGALAPSGDAVVASHGLAARVDPRTGAILELAELAHGNGMNACGMARAGRAAWIACALTEDGKGDLYDPFGVVRLDLAGALAPERPIVARNGEAALRVSPSGGAMLLGPCGADENGDACVRQPDGKWLTVKLESEGDLAEHGAGPLADGRVALLRGLWTGDAAGGSEAEQAPRRARIVAADATGKEHELAPIAWPSPDGALRVESPIEEDEDGSLRFVLADVDGAASFAVGPGAESATPQPIPGATRARVHAGRGIAVGDGHVLASLDAGTTWGEIAAPEAVLAAASRVARATDDPDTLAVSEVGARVDAFLRIGWGEGATPAPSVPARGGTLLAPRPAAAPTAAERVLTCTLEGGAKAARGAPAFVGPEPARARLEPTAPAPRGTRRELAAGGARAGGAPEATAVLEQSGPSEQGSAPARWTLRWLDPLELGGKVHAWSGPAPKDAAWGAVIRGAAASGARALVTVRVAGKHLLLRADAKGPGAIVEAGFDVLPGQDVVFGLDDHETLAWLHEGALVAWPKGQAPRAIASLAGRAGRALGAPTSDGVPVLVAGPDWAMLRSIPVPGPQEPAGARPPAVPLDGWAPVAPLRWAVGHLDACGPAPSGARVLVHRPSAPVSLDGRAGAADAAVFDVRVSASAACVAGVVAALPRDLSPGPAPPAGAAAVGLLRADLVGRRAEASAAGSDGAAGWRRLACTLAPRP